MKLHTVINVAAVYYWHTTVGENFIFIPRSLLHISHSRNAFNNFITLLLHNWSHVSSMVYRGIV